MSKITYTLPKSNEELSKVQDKAIRASSKARDLIQIALIATVHHLANSHDVRVARRIVEGLQETVRGKALVDFLSKYGHLTVGETEVEQDGKTVTVTTFTGIKGSADEHAVSIRSTWEEAKATMWWTLKQENPYKGFDLEQSLSNVLAQYKKALSKIEKGEASADTLATKVNDSTIKAVMALCKFETIANAANNAHEEVKAA